MPLEFVEKALEVADPKECAWYQTFDWPDGRVVKGRWDYRKNVDDYIGQMNFAEKSVIEIGPASGYITYAMEQRGARVTCIDTDPDQPWEIIPRRDRDTALYYEERKKGVLELRKSWFLSQQVLGGTARMSWCGATRLFDLRNDLNFDVGFVGSVLQHFENPYKVLSALASMCGTIVVTEQSHPRLNRAGSDIAEFLPAHNNNHLGTWWLLSASTVDRMMERLVSSNLIATKAYSDPTTSRCPQSKVIVLLTIGSIHIFTARWVPTPHFTGNFRGISLAVCSGNGWRPRLHYLACGHAFRRRGRCLSCASSGED
jgi:hypothetical protein